jgi:hypothetical protein
MYSLRRSKTLAVKSINWIVDATAPTTAKASAMSIIPLQPNHAGNADGLYFQVGAQQKKENIFLALPQRSVEAEGATVSGIKCPE